jgi:signal transduction histidine kinase
MRQVLPPGRSLRFYSAVSWLISGGLALVSCLMFFVGTAFISYRAEVNRNRHELIRKSEIAARRLSAEILIGQRGSVTTVSEILSRELSLPAVAISSQDPPCPAVEGCALKTNDTITSYYRVPFVADRYYAVVSAPAPKLGDFFQLRYLLWGTLPIAAVLAFGLIVQRFIFRRYVVRPIEALVETSTGDKESKPFWPKELREISDRLYRSFEERDQAVFSQIARGVIHDLRTLIHTPLGAVSLVDEQAATSEKRQARLEHLHAVARTQLPKMKEIIDTTLDGSREIGITPLRAPLLSSVEGAIRTLDSMTKQSRTSIRVIDTSDNVLALHDPIQLERAITNLVKNGIEACQENKGADALIQISIKQSPDAYEIHVDDNGPGLPYSPSKSFRPLKSTKVHGSGLGLVVSKKIVEAHRGELIPGRSELLGGAKFIIRLPASAEVRI